MMGWGRGEALSVILATYSRYFLLNKSTVSYANHNIFFCSGLYFCNSSVPLSHVFAKRYFVRYWKMGMIGWSGFHLQSYLGILCKNAFLLGFVVLCGGQFRNYSPIESILYRGKVLLISYRILVRLVYKCFWASLDQFMPLLLVLLLEGIFYWSIE